MKGKSNRISNKNSSKGLQAESTSRHQLRSMDYSQLFQPTSFTLSNIRLKFFLTEMAKRIKFLSPPAGRPEKVQEEWERSCGGEEGQGKSAVVFGKETLTEQLLNRFGVIKPLQVMQAITLLSFCWMVSVSIVFQVRIMPVISLLVALLTLIKIGFKLKVIWEDRAKDEKDCTYETDPVDDFVLPFVLVIAAFLMIVRSQEAVWSIGVEWVVGIYQVTVVVLHWKRIGRYFSTITHYAEQNKMRKELRIIQLFCFTLAMAHLFALIMYSMVYFCPTGRRNWLQKANLQGEEWYILYIYSYYWANTTMVTVGYGDLTPNNFVEAMVVTVIQVVGTAIFGYMINVIGITVNQIQKKNLEFQEHHATILKMKDHYNLTRELCYKMKNDIRKKQSQSKETPLKNNQETQFLEYIDSSLKEEFVLETNMKVIKKSIFFLTHFTVNFQNEVALKLIRCIYKPDQNIPIQQGGQRQLVIINSGKANIYCIPTIHSPDKTLLCRTIKPEEGKPTLNVIGFSSLILNRPLRLRAATQETTTAYILKRKDVLDSISKSVLDFQSFNELRERMLLMRRVEDIEAPAIRDIEQHYLPNIYLLTKKVKQHSQQRINIRRGHRKMGKKIITFRHYQHKTLLLIPHSNKEQENCESNYFIDLEQKAPGLKTLPRQAHLKSTPGQQLNMDQSKVFENFLKNFNVNVVSIDYEKACMKKSYSKRNRVLSKRSSTKKFKEI